MVKNFKVYFPKCIFPKSFFQSVFSKVYFSKVYFSKRVFPKCIFQTCIFQGVFSKVYFPKCIFQSVFSKVWAQSWWSSPPCLLELPSSMQCLMVSHSQLHQSILPKINLIWNTFSAQLWGKPSNSWSSRNSLERRASTTLTDTSSLALTS